MQSKTRRRLLLWVQGECNYLSFPWPNSCFSPVVCCSSLQELLCLFPECQLQTAGDLLASGAQLLARQKLFRQPQSFGVDALGQWSAAGSHRLVEVAGLARRLVWPAPTEVDLLQEYSYSTIR